MKYRPVYRRRAERGHTVAELVVVVAVIAIVASLALPGSAPDPGRQAETLAEQVAHAVRFARARSLSIGVVHGVHIDSVQQRLRVYRLDTSGATPQMVFDVLDPLTRTPYALQFDDGALDNHVFLFEGVSGSQDRLDFDGKGAPTFDDGSGGASGGGEWSWCWWCSGGSGSGTPTGIQPLRSAFITVDVGGQKRNVYISSLTGRVTTQ